MVMTLKKTRLGIALILLSPVVCAKDLGVMGSLFEIKEKDLMEIIAQKLSVMESNGTLAYHQNQLLEKAKGVLQTPHPVSSLTKTVNPRTFSWDPSISFSMDIKNHREQVIYKKGTRLNPLKNLNFKGQWLFFNGEDDKQKAWAKSAYKLGDKLILVRGSPLQLMQSWQLPVYFDQQGLLTRKMGIQQIPARVSQEGQLLKVEEIRLAEEPS